MAIPATTLNLHRAVSTDSGTFGILRADSGLVCWIVELPDRDNAPNLSCVPCGEYEVSYLARSASGRFRDCYLLHDVPDRSGILIHKGNLAGDTRKGYKTHSYGCLLPAMYVGKLAGQMAGLASKMAMLRLHEWSGRGGFRLQIVA